MLLHADAVTHKKLNLERETLAELSADELASVNGAFMLTGTETYRCPTLPVANCTKITTNLLTGTETGPSFVC